jgi:hypothetical protein
MQPKYRYRTLAVTDIMHHDVIPAIVRNVLFPKTRHSICHENLTTFLFLMSVLLSSFYLYLSCFLAL